MAGYDPSKIEPKWQQFWDERKTFKVEMDPDKPKYYILDMFPYPSGSGLHVGHPEGYTATDIISRYKRMRGFNVLHPMGWDAFGLPAEQHALKTGTHPRITTAQNIQNFKRQIKALGFSYDWDREVDTTDPDYYRWTQWIFLQLYNKGLAYLDEVAVNWCPELGTVLANEEVVGGVSERGGHPVVRRRMKQWMLKITAYADRLLDDLEELDWPEKIKAMQRNWIGRSLGAEVDFAVKGHEGANIRVFTTRPDTLFGATFMVLAPEHEYVDAITTDAQREAIQAYKEEAARKSDLERTDLAKGKSGVFTGAYAVNPVNGEDIPIWIADYVLISYGTGAIMSVPAHDDRDWEFARTFDLPIREVISGGNVEEAAHTGDGELVNSGLINGLPVAEAKQKITAWLEENGHGKGAVHYKLRDWLFCRQRYWGEPFPVVYREDGSHKPVPDSELPLRLPDVESYKPTGTPESPLAGITAWVNTTDPETGEPVTRETNTMPQWAGSCWYYLRFIDPKNADEAWSQEKENYWMPVDLYVGGAEHAVLHLLYARFWHKVLFDLGFVHTKEPFQKLFNQGMILGFSYRDADGAYVPYDQIEKRDGKVFHKETGAELSTDVEKMSKSRGNVVNPDDVVRDYGADALRLYEMFLGPLEQTKPWDPDGVVGVHRFLSRAWRLIVDEDSEAGPSTVIKDDATLPEEVERVLHQTIQKVGDDIDGMRFNTAIAQLMVLLNHFYKLKALPTDVANTFVLLLAPFAPHLAEELWQRLGHTDTLAYEPWPAFDIEKTREKSITMAVQVMGKTRATIDVPADAGKDAVLDLARNEPNVARYLEGKTIRKEIFVPGRIVNFVVS